MSTEKLKLLTKAEEQVMQAIWKLNKAFLREIVDAMPAPKPHQNTVATLLKILIEKKYVKADVIGRMHQYYPAISKDLYSKASMKNLVKGYFQGSFSEAVSFMVKENNLSIEELELLLQNLKKK
jgi:BlaI family transcriptional regulator, penicillinase repressor